MAHESLNVSTRSGGSKPMPCLSPGFMPLLSPMRMDLCVGGEGKSVLGTANCFHTPFYFEQTTRYAVEAVTADVLCQVW